MTNDDPYGDQKTYHMYGLGNNKGGVSPLCAARTKALNLKRELWTFEWAAVTCRKCLALRPAGAVSAWDTPKPSPGTTEASER